MYQINFYRDRQGNEPARAKDKVSIGKSKKLSLQIDS